MIGGPAHRGRRRGRSLTYHTLGIPALGHTGDHRIEHVQLERLLEHWARRPPHKTRRLDGRDIACAEHEPTEQGRLRNGKLIVELDPGNPGHPEVGNDHFDTAPVILEQCQAGSPISRLFHRPAATGEIPAERRPNGRLVIDDQGEPARRIRFRGQDVGLGARLWLNRLQLFSDLGGPLLGVRVDGAWTRITSYPAGRALSTGSAAVSLRLGYRFVVLRRLEVTPEAGVAVSFGFDAAPWLVVVPRPGAVFGLTVGYLF